MEIDRDLHTPICDLLGCRYAILQAGMGGVARSELVAAVTEAGGYGFLGMVRESPDLIAREIDKVRARTDGPFGVNLIPAATDPDLLEAELFVCLQKKVHSLCFFWDVHADVIARAKAASDLFIRDRIMSMVAQAAPQNFASNRIMMISVRTPGYENFRHSFPFRSCRVRYHSRCLTLLLGFLAKPSHSARRAAFARERAFANMAAADSCVAELSPRHGVPAPHQPGRPARRGARGELD